MTGESLGEVLTTVGAILAMAFLLILAVVLLLAPIGVAVAWWYDYLSFELAVIILLVLAAYSGVS